MFFADSFARVAATCLSAAPSTFAPLVANVSVPAGLGSIPVPGFFELVWPAVAPSGPYTFFVVRVAASALNGASANVADVVPAATATVSLGP